MPNWRTELQYFSRYSCAGVLNAIVGLGSIFLLMAIGLSPTFANIAGYALSLLLAFVTSKRFVFRSKGRLAPETLRYLAAFGLSFLCNLGALRVSLDIMGFAPAVAQGAAIAVYVMVMYSTSRLLVFPGIDRRDGV